MNYLPFQFENTLGRASFSSRMLAPSNEDIFVTTMSDIAAAMHDLLVI